jgi:ribosome maturation factor RimP
LLDRHSMFAVARKPVTTAVRKAAPAATRARAAKAVPRKAASVRSAPGAVAAPAACEAPAGIERPSVQRSASSRSTSSRGDVIERTVQGLGYELVDVERTGGGLLRVTIDRVPGKTYPTGASISLNVDDCEAVTHQLQFALEVEQINYSRLEVSSPGLDRPIKRESDLPRFVGQGVEITLREPLQGRKRFKGHLASREGGWRLLLDDSVGQKVDTRARMVAKAKAAAVTVSTLDFEWHEVRDAKLVPVVDFKGRSAASQGDHVDAAGDMQR